MKHTNFRTLNHAKDFYKMTSKLKIERHLKNQLDRASSSVALNLAEGSGRASLKEKRHFYSIAMGSFRECQSILFLVDNNDPILQDKSDCLGAHLYKLIDKTK